VLVACTGAPAVRAACSTVVGSIAVDDVADPGANTIGAQALTGTLRRLRDGVRNPVQDLAAAKTAGAQLLAASDIARVYERAGRELRAAKVGLLATPPRDDLARALSGLGAAWTAWGAAVQRGDSAAASRAAGRIAGGRTAARSARAALANAGYPEQS